MKKWAEDLVEAHRNPIVKLNIPGNKIYIPKGTEEEKALISKSIQILADTLKFERVERRSSRAKALWLPDQKLAKVTKASNIQNFVFQNKSGSYLFPEVALFLLETNRLEILWKNVPLSIQQAYSILLNDITPTLSQYKVYRTLSTQGYKVLRNYLTKSVDDESLSPPAKKMKIELYTSALEKKDSSQSEVCLKEARKEKPKKGNSEDSLYIRGVFERLAKEGATDYTQTFSEQSFYKMYLPNKSSKKTPDFNVHVIESTAFLPTLGMLKEDIPNLFGIVTPDSIAYYRFSKVNLPTLL